MRPVRESGLTNAYSMARNKQGFEVELAQGAVGKQNHRGLASNSDDAGATSVW